jgi:rhamnosyltransferase
MTIQEITAVVVTFHPDSSALSRLLETLSSMVGAVIVVDNGSPNREVAWISNAFPHVHCIFLETNLGLARGQNLGIDQAVRHGAEYVLLLDQDSLPAPDMVLRLFDAATARAGQGIAAVGPVYSDSRRSDRFFSLVRYGRFERLDTSTAKKILEVDYLISSGSLIPVTAFSAVGRMAECLFIDYVDVEWCFRARQHGLACYLVPEARLDHCLGQDVVQVMGRSMTVHSPIRFFYRFRNALWVYRQPYVPCGFAFRDGLRLVVRGLAHAVCVAPRGSYCLMMAKGIAQGISARWKKGREEQNTSDTLPR